MERAIRDRRRIWLTRLPDARALSPQQRRRGNDGRFRAWPLQLLFHNNSWYLAFETFHFARPGDPGLIRVLRVDRLVMPNEDGNARRGSEAEHEAALQRLERLLHVCGGLYFGESIDEQLAVLTPSTGRRPQPPWSLLRFSCTPRVFELIREEPHRFPAEHTTYPEPNPKGDSHPFPVEIRLPHWTIDNDWDLRNWLFRWGAGIRIEQPTGLRDLQLEQAREVMALYGSTP